METFYLIDFENVHNEGLGNIDALNKTDHVHIFYTENARNISLDIVLAKGIDIAGHKVPVRKQSLDMHLVSYLGYLLGINKGKQCSYIIISKDKDYDNIIKFWQEDGSKNISRKQKISSGNTANQKKAVVNDASATATQTINSKINAGMAYELSGDDRSELNVYMQHGLINLGYQRNVTNGICKCVIAHCNDERMLSGIHNELKEKYEDYSTVYEDVKIILEGFVSSKSKPAKRESQVRSFFGQHFKKKIYVDKKEEIIQIIIRATTRQQVNNELLKLYSDSNRVKEMIKVLKPLIKDLPGK